ncbi:substrate-binding domain-containing protein [Alkalihalobacterium bogoriense]|uniref:substrate-binding domain-containing protein n=1 Tax=Alkalihalobacterium bogoriense TaxID=246272 RepID=UPI00047C6E37|nr:substrate-binding domain-containing protein [Alkalihalobacterium bogoriense]
MKLFSLFIKGLLFFLLLCLYGCNHKELNALTHTSEIILATTTSTQDSGLLDELIPIFEEESGVTVKTIAVGTGQALAMAERGEADVLLTHAPEAEEKLVKSEDVINRKRVMYNDFVIVGPQSDPAESNRTSPIAALQSIADSGAPFISRGDDSGTHQKEIELWEKASIVPNTEKWYIETGQGMGSTLQVAAEKEGYTLTDRATFLSHQRTMEHMLIHVEGEELLMNIYHVMQVNADKHIYANEEEAKQFVDFLVRKDTQQRIKQFGIEQYGQSLFFPYTE